MKETTMNTEYEPDISITEIREKIEKLNRELEREEIVRNYLAERGLKLEDLDRLSIIVNGWNGYLN